MIDFSSFEKITGITFKDKKLLERAFIHRSYINENGNSKLSHNERLEFLGDAVLELVVTDFLFLRYPEKDEGDLTAYRSSLVNSVVLGEAAEKIGMNNYLLLSKGESKDTGKARSYILADTYEAFIGAVYFDQGYESAAKFIANTLLGKIDEIISKKLWKDSKSLVQEKSQENLEITPSYRIINESGPDHDKNFTAGIFFGKDKIASAKGRSKQEAEQAAARNALEAKDWLD
ncbi:MAG: ribonuclease III [Patescibacteria group bacterium]|nr:ribonuclease III [Patescibacteria group bacterium]